MSCEDFNSVHVTCAFSRRHSVVPPLLVHLDPYTSYLNALTRLYFINKRKLLRGLRRGPRKLQDHRTQDCTYYSEIGLLYGHFACCAIEAMILVL